MTIRNDEHFSLLKVSTLNQAYRNPQYFHAKKSTFPDQLMRYLIKPLHNNNYIALFANKYTTLLANKYFSPYKRAKEIYKECNINHDVCYF